MKCMISFGRRGFNVCLHHSNNFGVVLTSDRNLYNWNCSRVIHIIMNNTKMFEKIW